MKTSTTLMFPSTHPRVTEPPRHVAAAISATPESLDRSYWTSYDHFMIEREARAQRRIYTWSLMARGLRWIKAHTYGMGGADRRDRPLV